MRRTVVRTLVGGAVAVGVLEATTHLPSQGRSSRLYHRVSDELVVPAMRWTVCAETAHRMALAMAVLAPTYRPSAREQKLDVAVRLWGKEFTNPIGLAAGYDKDGTAIAPLLGMGFAFVEVGSVCLEAQPGNPSPRMWRLWQDQAIINSYGFNSLGADVVEEHLKEFQQRLQPKPTEETPLWQRVYDILWPGVQKGLSKGRVGINLGKNKTSATPIEDYQALIRQLGPYGDYLVINVSSPNTPGLRDLQATESLEALLTGCQEACRQLGPHPPPLLVKLSPDLTDEELQDIAALLLRIGIDGIILTNTTTARPGTLSSENRDHSGGLSGRPLRARSTECIRLLYRSTGGRIPIIGSGGVLSGRDAYEKLRAGASLVEVYTGLVYEGPGLVSRIRDEVAGLMIQNGQRHLQEDVVGLDHDELFWKKQGEALVKRDAQVTTVVLDQLEDEDEDQKESSQSPSAAKADGTVTAKDERLTFD